MKWQVNFMKSYGRGRQIMSCVIMVIVLGKHKTWTLDWRLDLGLNNRLDNWAKISIGRCQRSHIH